jgi:dTDP-4-amino-4,6-dideoxygalactose transaminase
LSFHPVKHITTGEGGAVLLNDAGRAAVLARLRTHGVVRGQEAIEGWEGPWHYDMVELGFNYRLTDIQCALGLSQLRKIERFITRRRMIARAYSELLADFEGVRLPAEAVGVRHAYHLYPLRVNFEQLGLTRRELFARCRNSGIALQVHYRPLVSNSYYRELAERQGAQRHLPVSANYYRETVSIPMYPQIGDLDVERVVSTLRHTLVAATDGLRHVTAQVDDV